MADLFFDTPWWLPALIAAVGAVLFVTGNNRLERNVKLAGLAAVAAAVVLMTVSYFVETPIERAERRCGELVDAFEKADWPAMRAILDPTASVSVLNYPIYGSRDEIMKAAEEAHARYGFKSVNVLSTDSERIDTLINVGVLLLSEQDALGRTLNSEWQFVWQETADGWVLVEVRALKIGNSSGDQVRGMFPGK